MDKSSKYVKMNEVEVDPKMFERFITGKLIDTLLSDDGGTMRACVIMVVGDPGVGKTTITNDLIADIQIAYPTLDVLFISSEEGVIDRAYNQRKSPKTASTPILFLGQEKNKVKALEEALREGWDIILIDSFKDTQDKVQVENPDMTEDAAEAWLLDLLVTTSQGQNKKGVYTTCFCIQQVTKGKQFAGSNSLKHNTTAMMEMRFSKEFPGQRYVEFTKNRRCGAMVNEKLYYSFDKATQGLIYSKEPFSASAGAASKVGSTVVLPKSASLSIEELLKYVPKDLSLDKKKKEIDKIKLKIQKGEPLTIYQ